MGRKSLTIKRKKLTAKAKKWLEVLLKNIQFEDLHKLTMDDIAKLAGVSKSTIYVYFKSKEEIIEAACNTRVAKLVESITEVHHHSKDTLQIYSRLIEVFSDGISDISLNFIQSIKREYPNSWNLIENLIDTYIDLLKAQYNKGIQDGIFNPISIDLLSSIDKLFVLQVVTDSAMFSDEKYTLADLVKDYLNLRISGLLKR